MATTSASEKWKTLKMMMAKRRELPPGRLQRLTTNSTATTTMTKVWKMTGISAQECVCVLRMMQMQTH
jgi:hypothetical protein